MALIEQNQITHEEIPEIDPNLLVGDALCDYIVTNGLVRTVSADPVGASYIDDIEDRLGPHLSKFTVKFQAHPEKDDNLVVSFILRDSVTVAD